MEANYLLKNTTKMVSSSCEGGIQNKQVKSNGRYTKETNQVKWSSTKLYCLLRYLLT